MRNYSKISKDWWDYTTLDKDILDAAARITINDLKKLERPGFKINIFRLKFSYFYFLFKNLILAKRLVVF